MKKARYHLLTEQISALIDGEDDLIAVMSNVCAAIHETMGFFWTGFSRVVGEELVLGPFQGPVACMHIAYGRGVCGTIVVPLLSPTNQVVAVLDIDSRELATFDDTDKEYLEHICNIITSKCMDISTKCK